jgi:hypothetical protein
VYAGLPTIIATVIASLVLFTQGAIKAGPKDYFQRGRCLRLGCEFGRSDNPRRNEP